MGRNKKVDDEVELKKIMKRWSENDVSKARYQSNKIYWLKSYSYPLQYQWKTLADNKRTSIKQFCLKNNLIEKEFSEWLYYNDKLAKEVRRKLEETVMMYLEQNIKKKEINNVENNSKNKEE